MNRTIKLIWDFKGDDAKKTSEHHQIHLQDFIVKEKLKLKETGTENLTESHSIAFMHVEENVVFQVRDALVPHRAEITQT